MIQITLIQIDNYGPWTVTPGPRHEPDLQTLQSRLYGDLEREFGARGGIVFFNRFDNLIAVSNGIGEEDHRKIQESIRNRYPITVSMGVAARPTPLEAQKVATEMIQKGGGAQSDKRCEVLNIESLASDDESKVQIAHIDINNITTTLTDVETAYNTSITVYEVLFELMKELKKLGALCFFIGGDNYMAPSNGITRSQLRDALKKVDEKTGVTLKAGVGISKFGGRAADLADLGLEDIRADLTDDSILVFHD
ncbi:GTP cyclohydrolase III [Methanosphaera sp. ISO3-F5]|uniref:GTP cyclohydrolase III n=1 Tax=Methanosphaera sp. ISO3-F5 TaxID=1452353 RepID=UPI002B259442|nr:GTP cyclohydrolase IIa [Methanosphaera sp. ISO3-F5]WQH64232.1 GTP cyclohydrolase IIa [Methanosphaera sp. ISO3-F5]